MNNRKIVFNSLFLYIRMFIVMSISLYTSRIILMTLGAVDLGIYNVVGGFVTMFSFINGCMIETSTRYISFELGKGNKERINEVFNVSLLIHVGLAIIIMVLCETIGLWFLKTRMTIPEERMNAALWVYQISIITTMFSVTQVPYNALIIAYEEMKIYAYVGIYEACAKLLIAFGISYMLFDRLIIYAFLLFLLQISILLFYRFYCYRRYEESHFIFSSNRSKYKELLSFASLEFLGSVSYILQGQGVNILLNIFFGPIVNAARGFAFHVQTAVMQFINNIMAAVRPSLTKEYAKNNHEYVEKLMINSSSFSFYLMLILMVPICFEVDNILKMWLVDYPKHTDTFIVLLLVTCLIQVPGGGRNIVLKATGRIRELNYSKSILSVISVCFAYFYLKNYGGQPEIIFFVILISTLLTEIIITYLFFKKTQYSGLCFFKDVYLRCLFVAIVSVAIVYLFKCNYYFANTLLSLLVTICISTLCVVLTVYIGGLNKESKKWIYSYLQNKIKSRKS